MEKQQIDAEPFVVDPQSLLATYESKVVAQFKEKGLQVQDKCVLRLFLSIRL